MLRSVQTLTSVWLTRLRNIRYTFNTVLVIALWRVLIARSEIARNLWQFILALVMRFVRFTKISSSIKPWSPYHSDPCVYTTKSVLPAGPVQVHANSPTTKHYTPVWILVHNYLFTHILYQPNLTVYVYLYGPPDRILLSVRSPADWLGLLDFKSLLVCDRERFLWCIQRHYKCKSTVYPLVYLTAVFYI